MLCARTLAVALGLVGASSARAQENIQQQGTPLTFEPSAGVTVEEQTLTITSARAWVSGVYRNTTERALEATVSFVVRIPLTGHEEESDEDLALTKSWQPAERWARGTAFKLAVDGRTRPFETLARRTEAGMEVSHRWRQTVPARGAIKVEHEYYPDGVGLGAERAQDPEWTRLKKEHCVGPKLVEAMHGRATVTRVTYLLKSGAPGPIGRFRLILKKTKPGQRISLCMDGLVKKSATTFELTARDFVPTEDLPVAFLDEVQCVDPKTGQPRECPP